MTQELLQSYQDIEDRAIERDAKAEAHDMFLEWELAQHSIHAKTIMDRFGLKEYPVLLIPNPRRCLLYQYTKSKYTSDDYTRIRKEEFIRLKSEVLHPGN
jgi:hypothetical protein